jgi:hypothetical protein
MRVEQKTTAVRQLPMQLRRFKYQTTTKRELCNPPMWPTTEASSKPGRLNTAMTSGTVSAEQLTNKPPLV